MQIATQKKGQLGAILMVVLLAIASAMTANTVSAGFAGVYGTFDVGRTLPGAATERYQGTYTGNNTWVENQYDNRFLSHRSDLLYSNNTNVTGPFTNIDVFHNDSFQFRVPTWAYTQDPHIIPASWYRQGGITYGYNYSMLSYGSVRAEGNAGFQLCSGGMCGSGVLVRGEWNLW